MSVIFLKRELIKDAVWAKFAYTAVDGKIYQVDYYNKEPMYMKDWLETINDYLKMTRRDILTIKGKVTYNQALENAHMEFEKYKDKGEYQVSLVEQHFWKV